MMNQIGLGRKLKVRAEEGGLEMDKYWVVARRKGCTDPKLDIWLMLIERERPPLVGGKIRPEEFTSGEWIIKAVVSAPKAAALTALRAKDEAMGYVDRDFGQGTEIEFIRLLISEVLDQALPRRKSIAPRKTA